MHMALKSTLQLLKRSAIRSTLNAMGQMGLGIPAGAQGRGLVMTLPRRATEKTFHPNARASPRLFKNSD